MPLQSSAKHNSQEPDPVTLAMIVAATIFGGSASVLIAAALSLTALARIVRHLVSLSAGLLLEIGRAHV